MRDIILVMSDQHSGAFMQNETSLRIPVLSRMADEAQVFENAYCNSPLCVPSRMSFLSGKTPAALGIYDNDTILKSEQRTIAHALADQGYRTVLVGRMHFKGSDQHHGFQERYVGDITTQWWGVKRDDLGSFDGTMKMSGCLNAYGYGDSPVQAFDDAVCEKALAVLKEKDDRPLFLVVGLYGPHFPYCVEQHYFDHYLDSDLHYHDGTLTPDSIYEDMRMSADVQILRNIRPAYYGLIERLDQIIGKLERACEERSLDALFIYTSDHGDQIGKRGLYGKKTLYEESIRIPLMIKDKRKKTQIHRQTVSLLDLGQTIANEAKAQWCEQEGEDLYTKRSPIHVSSIIRHHDRDCFIQAVIDYPYKLVDLDGDKRLYRLNPLLNEEECQYDDAATRAKLCDYLIAEDEKKELLHYYSLQRKHTEELKKWTQLNQPDDEVRFKIAPESTKEPTRRNQ